MGLRRKLFPRGKHRRRGANLRAEDDDLRRLEMERRSSGVVVPSGGARYLTGIVSGYQATAAGGASFTVRENLPGGRRLGFSLPGGMPDELRGLGDGAVVRVRFSPSLQQIEAFEHWGTPVAPRHDAVSSHPGARRLSRHRLPV
jgi:hypothetical protein